jgi:catechol 2,3-dioxygenase-like lactoylglutathione lyase family enzyme
MIRELPGLFKHGFIFDPWGTRIELVEDSERLGFHHIHLNAANPDATLAWYRNVLGGEPASLKGRQNGLRFGDIWVLVSRHEESTPTADTKNRSIDHVALVAKDFDKMVADLRQRKVTFLEQPGVPAGGRTAAKHAVLSGPDNVRIEIVQPGFAGVKIERTPAAVTTDTRKPYATPRTPWGEPDLQAIWTSNSAHGIPLERPKDLTDVKVLTPEEAAARRERGTLGGIWGYEREWRDTPLDYTKKAPSTQVAMVIDPPDGRVPPLTEEGRRQAQAAARRESAGEENAADLERLPAGPEDLSTYVRCITRGLPGMMMPIGYNNGLQIVQGPGFVAIQNEMIHETRIIPTEPRPRRGFQLTSWLGNPQGRWEGDTLVVETTNFNGRVPYRGSSVNLKMLERFTRVGPNLLEYRFTMDDPAVWTRPWTGMFAFDKDDDQYELVEYACHEANYGMTNILSGARAQEKAKGAAKK